VTDETKVFAALLGAAMQSKFIPDDHYDPHEYIKDCTILALAAFESVRDFEAKKWRHE
jgi:hypothetical protein